MLFSSVLLCYFFFFLGYRDTCMYIDIDKNLLLINPISDGTDSMGHRNTISDCFN